MRSTVDDGLSPRHHRPPRLFIDPDGGSSIAAAGGLMILIWYRQACGVSSIVKAFVNDQPARAAWLSGYRICSPQAGRYVIWYAD
jgi:hypothetical protein